MEMNNKSIKKVNQSKFEKSNSPRNGQSKTFPALPVPNKLQVNKLQVFIMTLFYDTKLNYCRHHSLVLQPAMNRLTARNLKNKLKYHTLKINPAKKL